MLPRETGRFLKLFLNSLREPFAEVGAIQRIAGSELCVI
jgi:hypothetical protein